MAMYEFTHQTMPTPEQFALLLKESDEQYDPLEELLILNRELLRLEQKHNLSSSEFYHLYYEGKAGDTMEMVGWVGRYRLYLELKEAISTGLKMVLAERIFIPPQPTMRYETQTAY
jgi:hypothetical protein